MVDPQTQALFRPYLLGGERILWAGRPRRGPVLRAADVYLIPFSLLWAGFAFSWNVEVWTNGAPVFFDLWGIPFLLAGLYVTVGRFLHEAWIRARIVYAVSNRRVLMLRAGPGGGLKSLELTYLPMLALEEKGDGRGTIRFDPEDDRSPWMGGSHRGFGPGYSSLSAFDRIEQPRTVYDLIRREADRMRVQQMADVPPDRAFIG